MHEIGKTNDLQRSSFHQSCSCCDPRYRSHANSIDNVTATTSSIKKPESRPGLRHLILALLLSSSRQSLTMYWININVRKRPTQENCLLINLDNAMNEESSQQNSTSILSDNSGEKVRDVVHLSLYISSTTVRRLDLRCTQQALQAISFVRELSKQAASAERRSHSRTRRWYNPMQRHERFGPKAS